MKNARETKKMNNKGFSMVELIIVVAIMAVLVVVLAPQYLRYVERSRNSTDRNNAANIESALLVWGSETMGTNLYPGGQTGTVTITATGGAVASGDTAMEAAINAALTNANITVADITCQSRNEFTQYIITVTIASDGNVTVTNDIPD